MSLGHRVEASTALFSGSVAACPSPSLQPKCLILIYSQPKFRVCQALDRQHLHEAVRPRKLNNLSRLRELASLLMLCDSGLSMFSTLHIACFWSE